MVCNRSFFAPFTYRSFSIYGFDYQKNPINFLNIKSFEGSEVTSMNLTFPDQWEGPYLSDNPTIQQKDYLIVKTKKGYLEYNPTNYSS